MMRWGIIGSSGGSAWKAAYDILCSIDFSIEVVVVTDRKCGLNEWAHGASVESLVIPWESRQKFSQRAMDYLIQKEVELSLLFFTRMLSAPLVGGVPMVNLHPSLLPSFPGLNPETGEIQRGVKMIGATLHWVDNGMDTGEIIAQIASPLLSDLATRDGIKHIGYAHKVALILLAMEMGKCGFLNKQRKVPSDQMAVSPSLSPTFRNGRLRDAYMIWVQNNCPKVVVHV
jgi:phosphoribosylglycinamide formyltransferase 1